MESPKPSAEVEVAAPVVEGAKTAETASPKKDQGDAAPDEVDQAAPAAEVPPGPVLPLPVTRALDAGPQPVVEPAPAAGEERLERENGAWSAVPVRSRTASGSAGEEPPLRKVGLPDKASPAEAAAIKLDGVPEPDVKMNEEMAELHRVEPSPVERQVQAAPPPQQPPAVQGPGAHPALGEGPAALVAGQGEADPGWRLGIDPASGFTAPTREATVPVASSAQANAVASQVSAAIRSGENDQIEIRLDPPELGRVQIEMRVVEGSLHAVLVAERPEIGDLLRRHAELLQRELESAGYESVTLDFASGRQDGSEQRNEAQGGDRPFSAVALAPAAAQAGRSVDSGRLDIRL